MIGDLIPLLAFTALVVIARNVFEAYVLERAQQRAEVRELAEVRMAHREHRDPRAGGRTHAPH
jgi:hypothetical protein